MVPRSRTESTLCRLGYAFYSSRLGPLDPRERREQATVSVNCLRYPKVEVPCRKSSAMPRVRAAIRPMEIIRTGERHIYRKGGHHEYSGRLARGQSMSIRQRVRTRERRTIQTDWSKRKRIYVTSILGIGRNQGARSWWEIAIQSLGRFARGRKILHFNIAASLHYRPFNRPEYLCWMWSRVQSSGESGERRPREDSDAAKRAFTDNLRILFCVALTSTETTFALPGCARR
ncbi:hypothetical protein BJ322DRAFT_187133 [Thelephora terrestris]|uniref:Uncharacterized protein n=1 Tax=Thelephora terrestris TaxID=56493 RepID=A0A9P6HAH6_9AGAM|nr:hypothetical protein BJ322DRAFT_187133 [Thelephora terrestris]